MHLRPTVLAAGVVGAGFFAVGWAVPASPSTVLALSFVSGTVAALGQLTTRDLLSKFQALVDRSLDEFHLDGGACYERAKASRLRAERLSWGPLICGVLSPASATMGTINPHHFWSGTALALAAIALYLAILLFSANRLLVESMDNDRKRRAQEKRLREFHAANKPLDPKLTEKDPNLRGFGFSGTSIPVESPLHLRQ